MNALIDKIRHLRFWPRILMFHGALIVMAIAYSWSAKGWSGMVLGSLLVGAVTASTFHHFRPYTVAWSRFKISCVRFANGLIGLAIFYVCLWGKYLEYGSLIGDEITWGQRIGGITLAGLGYILAGIFLGKGRFEPDLSVLKAR